MFNYFLDWYSTLLSICEYGSLPWPWEYFFIVNKDYLQIRYWLFVEWGKATNCLYDCSCYASNLSKTFWDLDLISTFPYCHIFVQHDIFVDNSTSLAHSPSAAELKMKLVQLYCSWSDVMLSRYTRCIFWLTKHVYHPFIRYERLLPHEHVKYRSVLFGQQNFSAFQITHIDKILVDTITALEVPCAYLKGYPTLATTVIFSTMWYFTTHLNIFDINGRRWKRLLEIFVLYRHT